MSKHTSALVRRVAKSLQRETTRKVVVQADLMETAPVPLRKCLQLVPSPIVGAAAVGVANSRYLCRRSFVAELLLGVALSGAAAATMLLACSLAWIMH
jgi:hypothetical protein